MVVRDNQSLYNHLLHTYQFCKLLIIIGIHIIIKNEMISFRKNILSVSYSLKAKKGYNKSRI